jgi:hypothetical protein
MACMQLRRSAWPMESASSIRCESPSSSNGLHRTAWAPGRVRQTRSRQGRHSLAWPLGRRRTPSLPGSSRRYGTPRRQPPAHLGAAPLSRATERRARAPGRVCGGNRGSETGSRSASATAGAASGGSRAPTAQASWGGRARQPLAKSSFGPPVRLPPGAIDDRLMDEVMEQRPQRLVGEAVVVGGHQSGAQGDCPEVEGKPADVGRRFLLGTAPTDPRPSGGFASAPILSATL